MWKKIKTFLIKALIDSAIALMDKPPIVQSSVIREYEKKMAEKEVRPLV